MVIVTNGNKYQGPLYPKLGFTKQDGVVMKKAFENEDLGFPCCHLEELTGEEIKVLIQEMGACKYPKSYQYVGFVYSGHGDKEDNKSVLVGVDESFVYTSKDVVEPLKKIDSIRKLIFFDACRGRNRPPTPPRQVTKGPEANCLVAYATRLGEVAFKHDTLEGSQWLLRLANKLTEKKSLRWILKEVKKEILNANLVQYPEVDLTDCPDVPIELWRGRLNLSIDFGNV